MFFFEHLCNLIKEWSGLFPEGADCTVLSLSWLERYTDNVEVGSSTLPGTTFQGGLAQLARALALQARGQRFESVILHPLKVFTLKSIIDMLYRISNFFTLRFSF